MVEVQGSGTYERDVISWLVVQLLRQLFVVLDEM
jgi:hypothetical protein